MNHEVRKQMGKPQVEMESQYYADYLVKLQRRLHSRWNPVGLHHRHLNAFIQTEVRKLPARAKVLDGGCGLSIWLDEAIDKQIRYTGIDCQESALAFCRTTYPHREYCLGDLYDLPHADQSFDMVVMREVIEHVKEPEKMVAEASRVLKPEGRFVLTTPNYGGVMIWLVENTYNRFFCRDFKPYLPDVHPSRFNREKLAAVLQPHFRQISLGTIDLGINLTAVCREPLK